MASAAKGIGQVNMSNNQSTDIGALHIANRQGYAHTLDKLQPMEEIGPMMAERGWFNDLIQSFGNQAKARQLRSVLAARRYPDAMLSSASQRADMVKRINEWHKIDLARGEERWCQYGFRHRLSDDQYSMGSTMEVLAERLLPTDGHRDISLDARLWRLLKHYTTEHKLCPNCGSSDPSRIKPDATWCGSSTLYNLMIELEEVAFLLDRDLHQSPNVIGVKDQAWVKGWDGINWERASHWTLEILAFVAMENSLKSLWHLQNPDDDPKKRIRHGCEVAYGDLQHCRTELEEQIFNLPIMWGFLRPDGVDFMFKMIPSWAQKWHHIRYGHNANCDAPFSSPHNQFALAVAAYFVALRSLRL